MARYDVLFSDGELRDFLLGRESQCLREIEALQSNYILNVNAEELAKTLYQKYLLSSPQINAEQISVDQEEKKFDISEMPRRAIFPHMKSIYVNGTEVRVFIPFSGDAKLLSLQPSAYTCGPPRGKIEGNNIVVEINATDEESESIRKGIHVTVEKIKNWLKWVENDVNSFHGLLKNKIEQKIKTRCEKLKKDQEIVSNLGYPLKRKEGAPQTYSVPIAKKKVEIELPAPSSAPLPLEPILNLIEYENILGIMSNMSKVMERSPKAFSNMLEEDIRTHFLVQLNGQYEGQATGETFNFNGKTDILIRVNGKNIFIAECAFWNGEKYFVEKIDQLLGYTSWRDTKTAVLIFNRNKDLSKILAQIPDILKKYPYFVKQMSYSSETGFRFVLHHKDDKERHLILTVLLFEVPACPPT